MHPCVGPQCDLSCWAGHASSPPVAQGGTYSVPPGAVLCQLWIWGPLSLHSQVSQFLPVYIERENCVFVSVIGSVSQESPA